MERHLSGQAKKKRKKDIFFLMYSHVKTVLLLYYRPLCDKECDRKGSFLHIDLQQVFQEKNLWKDNNGDKKRGNKNILGYF